MIVHTAVPEGPNFEETSFDCSFQILLVNLITQKNFCQFLLSMLKGHHVFFSLAIVSGLLILYQNELERSDSVSSVSMIQIHAPLISDVSNSKDKYIQPNSFARRKAVFDRLSQARLQKLFDLDGPQSTDAPYKDWYKDGTTDAGRPKSRKSNLAAIIKAAYPKD
jgi:hypothetical protein